MEENIKLLIKDYLNYLEDKELINCEGSIDLYISANFYELQDSLDEILRNEFEVPKDLDDIQAISFIEEKEKNILLQYLIYINYLEGHCHSLQNDDEKIEQFLKNKNI